MKQHKYKRKAKSKKAKPLPRSHSTQYISNYNPLAIAAAFTAGLCALFTQEPVKEENTTEDAEFTVEDPKQLPPAQ